MGENNEKQEKACITQKIIMRYACNAVSDSMRWIESTFRKGNQ